MDQQAYYESQIKGEKHEWQSRFQTTVKSIKDSVAWQMAMPAAKTFKTYAEKTNRENSAYHDCTGFRQIIQSEESQLQGYHLILSIADI